jgi:hypothetical protein
MGTDAKDTLLLLAPDFATGGRRCYCPACATIEGLLGYYPQLRSELDVRYIGFTRPRPDVVELIGAANQGLPALVLANAVAAGGPASIGRYLARRYGIGEPH